MSLLLLQLIVFFSFWERLNIYIGFSLTPLLLLFPFYLLAKIIPFYTKIPLKECIKKTKELLKQLQGNIPTKLWKLLGLVIAAQCLSILTSEFPAKTLQVVFFQVIKFGLMIVVILACRSEKIRNKILATWITTSSVTAVIAIVQFVVYKLSIRPTLPHEYLIEKFGLVMNNLPADHFTFPIGNMLFIRPNSTFIDTNTAAGFLGVSIILLLGLLLHQWKRGKSNTTQKVLLVSLLLHLIAFGMMLSRSAWLGLFAGIGCFVALILKYEGKASFQKIKQAKLFKWGILLLIGIALFPSILILKRLAEVIFFSESSLLDHVSFTSSALQLWMHNPLFGIGAGTFELMFKAHIDAGVKFISTTPVYLHWLTETGVLGLITQLGLIAYVLQNALKGIKKGSSDMVVRIALLSGFIALLVANCFYSYLISPPVFVLMGITL